MAMAFQIDTVFVWVTDLDRSKDWYSRLGIEAGAAYGPWQTMNLDGDARFALHQGERAEGPSTAVPSFRVDDLDAEIGRLAALDITPSDSEITDTGISRFTTFTDPDGNDVQLLERR